MKRTLFYHIYTISTYILISSIFLASCHPQNKVIEKPIFLTKNNTSIEVSKVSLMDTITILNVIANGSPGSWIKIAKSSTLTDDKGKVYPVLSGKGIELGEKFIFPETAKDSFQLIFPALEKDAKFIDFSEGPEVENGLMIGGIQLKDMQPLESLLPEDILSQKIDKNRTMDEQPFVFGKATIKGRVLDYYPGMPKYVNITSFNPLIGNCGYINIELEPDGSFEHTLHVLGTSIAWVYYSGGATTAEIFVAAEQTSEVYFNLREAARKRSEIHADSEPFGKEFYYKGPLGTVVYELAEAQKLLREEYKLYDFNKAPDELMEEYKQIQIGYINQWTEAIHHSHLSKATKEYMLAGFPVSLTLRLINAPSKLAEIYGLNMDVYSWEKSHNMFEKLKKVQTPAYFAYDISSTHNNPQSFFTADFGLLVKSLTQNKHIETEGILNEMVTAARLYTAITEFMPLSKEQKEIIANMSEPCIQYLNATNDYITSIKENNKKTHGFRINETGETSNEDLFASIISKHRGKVVLIDFWATWCGPCVAGHKSMRPMKAELADKDIVYVYIAGENSPKERWEQMTPEIHGEHYRLTHEQWDYLWKTFNISGIPTYFIHDRDGNITFRCSGFPGVTQMKEELMKALN